MVNTCPGDVFVLCSDGLSRYLDAKATGNAVAQALIKEPKSAAQVLIERALAAGGEDNVTAIVVGVLP